MLFALVADSPDEKRFSTYFSEKNEIYRRSDELIIIVIYSNIDVIACIILSVYDFYVIN
jgi:hypothetical protein